MKDKYFSEWPEVDGLAEWVRRGRAKLNIVIGMTNNWTLKGCPIVEAVTLLRYIDQGLQTFAAEDGGSAWADDLREMKLYIEDKVNDDYAFEEY